MDELGFRVEPTRPAELLERLATSLAEALADQELMERQAKEYHEAAGRERKKATQLREVLRKLQEGDYEPQGRMDPYATYDQSAVFKEMEQADDRADSFMEMAAASRERLSEAWERQNELQAKIKTVRAQMRRRE